MNPIGYPKVSNGNLSLRERFEQYIFYSPDGCWYWLAAYNNKGYGLFWFNNKLVSAHRMSHELYLGPIPDGLHILHKCDNPKCVNPDHFFLGSYQENSDDKMRKGRQKKNKGVEMWNAILTEDDVRQIRARYTFGKGVKKLADEFNISTTHLYFIVTNRRWKHLTK